MDAKYISENRCTVAMATVQQKKLRQVIDAVEALVDDASKKQDVIVRRRRAELQVNPSLAKHEHELDAYLRRRGVRVDR